MSFCGQQTCHIGIDIAMSKFDVHLLRPDSSCVSGQFQNSAKGWSAFEKWSVRQSKGDACRFTLEPTGCYSLGLLRYLWERDCYVSQVNPYTVKHFAISRGLQNKTDKVDARTLAYFSAERKPDRYVAPSEEKQELTDLTRYLNTLKSDLQALKNKRGQPYLSKQIAASLDRRIASVEEEIAQIEKQINQLSQNITSVQEDVALLTSIPGLGEKSALTILAELPDIGLIHSAQSVGALAGLNPRRIESGKLRGKTKISRRGRRALRSQLYFPALTAIRYNPLIAAFAHRLKEKGKPPLAVIAAATRKLLMIAYGVLKSRRPFDPNYRSLQPQAT